MYLAREKVALLIGNQNYSEKDVKSLSSPHNDIKALADTLKPLGFKIFSFCDLNFSEMMKVLDFYCALLDSGVLCVFYYSGHGFDYKNNGYLMPVDVCLPINRDSCIAVELVSHRLQMTRSKVFMFLDCCRVRYKLMFR